MSHIYGLNAEASKYAAHAAEIAKSAGKNAGAVDEKAAFPAEALQALASGGFYGLCLPASVGGKGQGPRTFAAVVEELAQCCASTAMIYVMHVVATQAIASSKTLGGKDELLKQIAAGKHLTTLAFSEKGSRSNFWLPVSRLQKNGKGFTTDASKSWVTAAGHADSYVSSAQKPDAAAPVESTCYLVRKGAKGLKIEAAFNGLGLRGNDSSPVTLTGVHVDEADLISEHGAGIKTMLEVVLPWFSIGTAAMANGLCRAAISATASHLSGVGFSHTGATQREKPAVPGDMPVGEADRRSPQLLRDLQNLRFRLADMSVRTEQARSLLGYTLGLLEAPTDFTPLYVLQTRLASMEAALYVTDLGMKAGGGAAFSKHLPLERLFRDARAGWVMAPTVDHLQDFIGKALTGMPLL